MVVLDSSALLASLFGEPGYERVDDALHTACISAVNLAEVMARLVRDGMALDEFLRDLDGSDLEVVPFDLPQARLAAEFLPQTRRRGLSLGDRACLALASIRALPVLTADRAWAQLRLPVEVRLIR